jgi:hypothetical protein
MTEERLIEIERRIATATVENVISILMEDVPEVLAELRTYMGIFGQDTQRFLQGGGVSATTHAPAKQGGDVRSEAPEGDRGSVSERSPDLAASEEVSLRGQLRKGGARRTRSSRKAEGGGAESGGASAGDLRTPLPIEPRGFGAP